MNSTTDGWAYRMLICSCGRQNSAGICSHFPNGAIYREQFVGPWAKLYPLYRQFAPWAVITLTLMNTGCMNHFAAVQRYQEKATADCLKHHTAEECRALPYPSEER